MAIPRRHDVMLPEMLQEVSTKQSADHADIGHHHPSQHKRHSTHSGDRGQVLGNFSCAPHSSVSWTTIVCTPKGCSSYISCQIAIYAIPALRSLTMQNGVGLRGSLSELSRRVILISEDISDVEAIISKAAVKWNCSRSAAVFFTLLTIYNAALSSRLCTTL